MTPLRLSLAHCEVLVGERITPQTLQALLLRPVQDTRLLYPETDRASVPTPAPDRIRRADAACSPPAALKQAASRPKSEGAAHASRA